MIHRRHTLRFVLLGLLLSSASAHATLSYTIPVDCSSKFSCAEESGTRFEGRAKMGGKLFIAFGEAVSCCKLAIAIHFDACEEGINPMFVEVKCK